MKRCIGEMQDMLMHAVTLIADMLGFSSICHFNAMFKKYTGLDRICHSAREIPSILLAQHDAYEA